MTKYSIIEACVSTVKSVLEILKIPVKVMVRLYNSFDSYELEDRRLIKTQLKALRSAGVRDYVFGSLKEDRLDIDDLTWFYKEIRDIPPTSLTIHKAIDASVDIIADIQLLLDSDLLALAREDGCEVAILSSGGASTAQAGTSMLNQMHAMCGNHIEI